MNTVRSRPLVLVLALLGMLVLAACGGARPQSAPAATPAAAGATSAPAAAPGNALSQDSAARVNQQEGAGAAAPAAQATVGPAQSGAQVPPVQDPSRKIIKDASFILEVDSLDLALSSLNAAAAQVGGYVLETRTDARRNDMRNATLRIAVPVDRFEDTLQRVRESATKILDEQTSGVDVSAEFVDVQSQIANLEATQARVREFLTQATTVEEALQVNARLTEIEGQLSQLKGRLQFLSQRAAFSTITVQLQQPLVATTPSGLPAWNPGKIAADAYATLTVVAQTLATIVIWLAIVVLPILAPFVLIGYLLVRLVRRRPATPPRVVEPK